MSRFLFFMLSAVLLAGNAAALSPDTDRQQPGGRAATENDQPSDSRDSSRKPAQPAATFNPTERIGADSAVSFPVDI
jgi:hypothetical protein